MSVIKDKTKTGSEETDKEKTIELDLDSILINELGQFGLFQFKTLAFLLVWNILLSWASTEYIFTTARIGTRCFIPECETRGEVEDFAPDWLLNAVPSEEGVFDGCRRFANTSSCVRGDSCPAELFDSNSVVPCEQFVYENTNTIIYEFDLGCDEWRRTLIGSLRTVGVLISLPVTGVVSDRWGRRIALIITALNTACVGALRYFAASYAGYLVALIAESTIGGGGFTSAYILVMEMVGPKYQVAASAMFSTSFAVGQALVGLIAWNVPYWRHMTLVVFLPTFIVILYFWLLPESVRWYISKRRYDDARNVLEKMARINKRQLSEQSLLALKQSAEEEIKRQEFEMEKKNEEPWLIVLVFKHKPILLRCVVSPVWWMTTMLVYYGLNVNSVNISGNAYLNFMAVAAIEIPGFWIASFLMNVVGRKPVLIVAFWVCACCQLAYLLIPNDNLSASLAVYLVGKTAIAMTMTTLYVYTTELYPTGHRSRLLSFSSMMGRIGAIVAPLTPAFGEQVPFILFGSAALLAGLLVLLTPETRGARLPDTMEEAARTGRKISNRLSSLVY